MSTLVWKDDYEAALEKIAALEDEVDYWKSRYQRQKRYAEIGKTTEEFVREIQQKCMTLR